MGNTESALSTSWINDGGFNDYFYTDELSTESDLPVLLNTQEITLGFV